MNKARPKIGSIRLIALCAASIPVLMAGAAIGRPGLVTLAAAAITFIIVVSAATLALAATDDPAAAAPGNPALTVTESRRAPADLLAATRLTAIAYGWAALAMKGLYSTLLTGLNWQHGWEYALAMALLCGGTLIFERQLLAEDWRKAAARAVPLAGLQAVVAAGGLVYLLATGKLGSVRADWGANRVFVALAVSILAIAIASIAVARQPVQPT